ncbi:MAG: purine-nucleoside phosphorylase [Oscillospiraceae bacterium]|jgi:purine-nucleoside phosphorylase|nr:purine-nucleoside phosphorylase [Oscillospiraceae bacterium]
MEIYDLTTVDRAAESIRRGCGFADAALIAGSGLGGFAATLEDRSVLPYKDIPGFPVSTAPGHAGEWVGGECAGRRLYVMNGRVHCYEGHDALTVAFPIRVMARLGVKTLIVTNAAGGVNTSYKPGDFMVLSDFINLTGWNPLRGANIDEFGPRFPDMSKALDESLARTALDAAAALGVTARAGVYAMMTGPSYETPAEIRMLRTLGADAVGMSTVPEIIAARHSGIRVLGISCITNMASGILPRPLTHAEVMETGERARDGFAKWVGRIVGTMG